MSHEKIGSVYSSRQGLDNIWVPTFATLMRQLQRRRGRPGQEEASNVGGGKHFRGAEEIFVSCLGPDGRRVGGCGEWGEGSLQSTKLIDGTVKNYGRTRAASTTVAAQSIGCKSGLTVHGRRNI